MNFKNLLLIPLLIVVVVAMSGCVFESGNHIEKNGVDFYYPDNWHEAKSIAEGSLAAVAYSNNSQIAIVIQQVPSEYGSTVDEAYANNDKLLSQMPGYVNVQENVSSVNGRQVKLHRYILNDQSGVQKEYISSWIKMDDSKLYVILYAAPVENYEQYKGAYDKVVSSFSLKSDKDNQIWDQIYDKLSNIKIG